MTQQVINIGAAPNDGTGDQLRTAFDKSNDNFTELYKSAGTISGGLWNYSKTDTDTSTAPVSGRFKTNSGNYRDATQIAIHGTTIQGIDRSYALRTQLAGDIIQCQDLLNSAAWCRYVLQSSPVDNGAWFQLAVALEADGGVASADNQEIIFAFTAANISASGGGSGASVYRFDTGTGTAPGTGDLRLNNAMSSATTALYLNNVNDAGSDIKRVLLALGTSTKLVVQDQNNSAIYADYTLASTPIDHTTWTEFTVTYLEGTGTFANNIQVVFSAIGGGEGGGGGITINTSPITGGASGSFLYDNAGTVGERSPTQATAALDLFSSTLKGLTPLSGGGTANFLRADGTWAAPAGGTTPSPPQRTVLTSGSGTYTTPAGATWLEVEMVGGGGGGGGGNNVTAATSGTATTFTGTGINYSAGGGTGGKGATDGVGGAGGTATASGGTAFTVAGGMGSGANQSNVSVTGGAGGSGGNSSLGGAGGGAFQIGAPGGAAAANSGSGGGGGGADGSGSIRTGQGGGAGATINATIASPTASYSYTVGAGGNGATGLSGGSAGGNGGSGVIIVTEFLATSTPIVTVSSPPQRTVLTSGSGTYTTPAGATWLEVEMVGGGGGGTGGDNNSSTGTAGGNTTFGTLTAGGGAGGLGFLANAARFTAGGTASGGDVNIPGGNAGAGSTPSNFDWGIAGYGGNSFFGAGGVATWRGVSQPPAVNTGAGGAGGSADSIVRYGGMGGGAGGYVRKLITPLAATYAYTVGAGGNAGPPALTGWAGSAGAAGIIIVTAHLGG